MKLYTYFRSGAAWRVRIGQHWKMIGFESIPLNLRENAQLSAEYRRTNPQALIPSLETDDGIILTQSLAILEWLEETHPEPPFLPVNPTDRAKVRAIALAIGADIHPIQNSGILKRIEALAGAEAARKWAHDTISNGLNAVEALITPYGGPFAFGEDPTLADIFLVPQLFNARRFKVDLNLFPNILRAEAAASALACFRNARPEAQPDTE